MFIFTPAQVIFAMVVAFQTVPLAIPKSIFRGDHKNNIFLRKGIRVWQE